MYVFIPLWICLFIIMKVISPSFIEAKYNFGFIGKNNFIYLRYMYICIYFVERLSK